MSKKILANDGIDATGKQLLEKAGYTIITEKVAQEKLAEEINKNNYVALTVRSATKVRKDVIDACPNLKVIGRGGVGMDNIDVDYAKSKGIQVINTPAASSNAVAELVFSHLFGIARMLHESNRLMPTKGNTEFDKLKKTFATGTELRGKTIGIIGFGRIGQHVASIALGCGMNVLAFDPFVKETTLSISISGTNGVKVNIKTVGMDDLLKGSDFITVHVPGGKVLTAKELGMCRKGVILLNTSRGGVIDENDLLAALTSGQVGFAALDVFENEPTPRQELITHPKISLSPHIGASTNEAQERIGVELAEKIIEALK